MLFSALFHKSVEKVDDQPDWCYLPGWPTKNIFPIEVNYIKYYKTIKSIVSLHKCNHEWNNWQPLSNHLTRIKIIHLTYSGKCSAFFFFWPVAAPIFLSNNIILSCVQIKIPCDLGVLERLVVEQIRKKRKNICDVSRGRFKFKLVYL